MGGFEVSGPQFTNKNFNINQQLQDIRKVMNEGERRVGAAKGYAPGSFRLCSGAGSQRFRVGQVFKSSDAADAKELRGSGFQNQTAQLIDRRTDEERKNYLTGRSDRAAIYMIDPSIKKHNTRAGAATRAATSVARVQNSHRHDSYAVSHSVNRLLFVSVAQVSGRDEHPSCKLASSDCSIISNYEIEMELNGILISLGLQLPQASGVELKEG
ncbi:hypothetical protein BDZ91DRAFT_758860 [Kalaharituber pfeilii]|nr:hypothetical protein BDZ91DRAFT_758860 [Kalaharituber pfeilii]